ncbi:LolA family protein [Agromyces sp. NPDC055520]
MRTPATGPSRRFSRWIPAIAAPIAIGIGVVLVPMQANAAVDLPDLTPEQLLELAASSDVDALSGTIEQSSELGLPDLSGLTGAMGGPGDEITGDAASATDLADLISLATGTHTARLYLDGSNARLQVLDPLAERNVYLSPDGAWVYDSAERAATHVTVDRAALDALKNEVKAEAETHADEARARLEAELGTPLPTPDEVLDRALATLDETTEVSVGTDARVAGREVYELVLQPRDAETLVGEITVAIDGETGVALAASVTARGAAEPAFSVAFTEVSFEAPDASVFAFTPPEGTAVTEHEVPIPTLAELEQLQAERAAGTGEASERMPQPIVHGDGWSTVVELPVGAGGAGAAVGAGGETSAMLGTLTQPVDGGRLLQTSLVTVLLTDDGRVLAGAVTADRLLDVANGR